ncbi:MAG: DUF433 domain-containing protein [Chloroflexi bacterium]|nr:DUF433 domain-containing protein [Chloroflexota bacterium]
MDADALIAKHIEPDPLRPGPDDVRLKPSGVPVWAIVGQYLALDRDAAQVARDYGIPLEAVEAALAYYERHQAVINGRLAANAA